jgi:cytochrome oxidase Cu insertion factor (SCO1/SenC/PrrC family)
VADHEARVWSFAEIPAKRESLLVDAMAPEFEITDRQGKVIRLADLKGKKALIVTWSSW